MYIIAIQCVFQIYILQHVTGVYYNVIEQWHGTAFM